ncbi:hypothetical protein [Paenibacillus phytohabitans]|uniref:hypothetical protein n=1 Tax=Paenibacillus phytohabitans TaxID=2654978 RepID=UPI003008EDFB
MNTTIKYDGVYQSHVRFLVDEYFAVMHKLENASNLKQLQAKLKSIKRKLCRLDYMDVLALQNSIELWHLLMNDPDLYFRRTLCRKLFNLSEPDVAEALGYSAIRAGAAHNLFNSSGMPHWPRPFKLSILLNHPWQLVNKIAPEEFSYSSPSEYFDPEVTKKIYIKDLFREKTQVRSIAGFVILNPQELLPLELPPLTGRWVTTYPEMDYFEFHLNHEPILDKAFKKRILSVFPFAKDAITTYVPFRSKMRSLWIMMPKVGREQDYNGLITEFKGFRDATVHCQLR